MLFRGIFNPYNNWTRFFRSRRRKTETIFFKRTSRAETETAVIAQSCSTAKKRSQEKEIVLAVSASSIASPEPSIRQPGPRPAIGSGQTEEQRRSGERHEAIRRRQVWRKFQPAESSTTQQRKASLQRRRPPSRLPSPISIAVEQRFGFEANAERSLAVAAKTEKLFRPEKSDGTFRSQFDQGGASRRGRPTLEIARSPLAATGSLRSRRKFGVPPSVAEFRTPIVAGQKKLRSPQRIERAPLQTADSRLSTRGSRRPSEIRRGRNAGVEGRGAIRT